MDRREPLLRHAVGDLLRRERHRRGMTLRDLAAASQVSLAFLSEVERGRKEPSSEVLAAICRALGLRLLDLVSALHDDLAAGSGTPVLHLARAGTEIAPAPRLTSSPTVLLAA